MNIASHARGLLAELAGSVRLGRDNQDAIRAELRANIAAARKTAVAEQAALDPKDRDRERYATLLAELDAFEASDVAKPAKVTAVAPTAPEKA